MRLRGVHPILLCLWLVSMVGYASADAYWVPATADVFLGGQPDGTVVRNGLWSDSTDGQAAFELPGIGLILGTVLTFSAAGLAHITSLPPISNPDGIPNSIISFLDPRSGAAWITVIVEPIYTFQAAPVPLVLSGFYNMPAAALIGVFTSEITPPLGTTSLLPSSLDFGATGIGTDFQRLEPEIRQIFFIGDGQTSGGISQQFVIPVGAKHLYLAVADVPGCFNDNPGGFTVQVQVVPETSSLLALLCGIGGMGWFGLKRTSHPTRTARLADPSESAQI